jgi:hypothetical protein
MWKTQVKIAKSDIVSRLWWIQIDAQLFIHDKNKCSINVPKEGGQADIIILPPW